jgi:hypothetical protein
MSDPVRIIDSRHPVLTTGINDWELWRKTYAGGSDYRYTYLKQFTTREETTDFNFRRDNTPIPTFARAAVNDIRNAIFQRMRDILRRGGSDAYQKAINGERDGVDRNGSTMNAFLGMKVLTDLLVMGRVGIYVDAPVIENARTLAEAPTTQPYLYQYAVEDILNWRMVGADKPSQFQSVLLRDTTLEFDQDTYLPTLTGQRYRLMWIDADTGDVMLQFYNMKGEMIDSEGLPATEPTRLELKQIPFIVLDIGDSLLKDVAYYQIALLNLVSSDVNYALKANFPFLVEQRDLRAIGAHLKRVATEDGTSSAGGQGAADEAVKVGVVHGRVYGLDMDPPSFINPSSETLTASQALQVKLEADIRKLINLAVTNIGARASADSKEMDNQGLEAGLSFIGLVLENAERQVAKYWAAYENRDSKQQLVATIKYPDRYSLKTDTDRIHEAEKLAALVNAVPGRTVKKELSKLVVASLLAGKVDLETIAKIEKEIDSANYTTSDPKTLVDLKNAGLCGSQTASVAAGFDEGEAEIAEKESTERAKRIAAVQGVTGGGNPAARGVKDLAVDDQGGSDEKELSRNTDLQPTTMPRVRGDGRQTENNNAD